jgi:hypothetical protein
LRNCPLLSLGIDLKLLELSDNLLPKLCYIDLVLERKVLGKWRRIGKAFQEEHWCNQRQGGEHS